MQFQHTTILPSLVHDVKRVQKILDQNNFYQVIDTYSNPSCKSRKDQIVTKSAKDSYFKYRTVSCRLGRSKSPECPLCDIVLAPERVHPILQKVIGIKMKHITNLALIPNAFPYMQNHWLLVRTDHFWGHYKNKRGTQYGAPRMESVLKVAMALGKGSFFFNGMCGNSLEHFHVHFTSETLPLFENPAGKLGTVLETSCEFRSNLCACHQGQFFSFRNDKHVETVAARVETAIRSILSAGYDYNYVGFVGERAEGGLLLITRDCTENFLNFGASELAGLVMVPATIDGGGTLIDATKKASPFYPKKKVKEVCQRSVIAR